MIAGAWDIRHIDLSGDRPEVAASPRPLFAVFWWRALPLGVRTYLPEQLPLDRHELASLAAEFTSAQLAARAPQFGGPVRATFDGRPFIRVPVDTVSDTGNLLDQLDTLADTAPVSASELSVIVCTRDRPEPRARCLARLAEPVSQPGQIKLVVN
jgi:hypothetical protein